MNWKYLPEYPPLGKRVLLSSTNQCETFEGAWDGTYWGYLEDNDISYPNPESIYAWTEMPEKAEIKDKYVIVAVLAIVTSIGTVLVWDIVDNSDNYKLLPNYVCTFRGEILDTGIITTSRDNMMVKLYQVGYASSGKKIKVIEIIHIKSRYQ